MKALWFAVIIFIPLPAAAQTFFTGYFGSNYTSPATVSVQQPSRDTALSFENVKFSARPFASPIYYGWRFGRMIVGHRYGFELEFIHLKVIGQTSRVVHITGRSEGVPVDESAPMNTYVEQFQMTHGLNFILANFVLRQPLGGAGAASPAALFLRVGAGPTVPHAESIVGNQKREQYEYAGHAAHVSAGINLRVKKWISTIIEYKATYARPRFSIADGAGATTALTQQIAVGFAFGLSR